MLSTVHTFWNTAACGAHFVEDAASEEEYFARYSAFRYRKEWHIPRLVPFASARGKKVLEIGCGNGADGAMFASHGADYTGVDLTEAAVDATRRHLATRHLPGTAHIDNAEQLSFPDASFDIVYSWGVLHHTPDIDRAVREVHRVLRPGGWPSSWSTTRQA